MAAFEQQLELIEAIGRNTGLEPECGDGGGEIVAAGTPEDVVRGKRSYTGQYLKEVLKRGRKEAAE